MNEIAITKTAHTHRRLMNRIRWHRMLGNLMLRLPWIGLSSPVLLRRGRKLNACCMALYRLEKGLHGTDPGRTAA